jgi:hypothetical protein
MPTSPTSTWLIRPHELGCLTMVVATTLICSIFDRWQLLIDVVILIVLGLIHAAAWENPDENSYQKEAQEGVRSAAAAGLTVAGILIPLSILTISLTLEKEAQLSTTVLTDFFVANLWLVISLLLGLYVLFFVALHGYTRNILSFKGTGVVFGLQLLFLGVGTFRLVWGLAELVNELIT